jgi:inosine-uridine nucleoside N-ribohydrolase
VHDAVCAAYLVRPDIVTPRHLHVTVDTASPLTIGRTVIDTRPNAADARILVDLLVETWGASGVSSAGRQA